MPEEPPSSSAKNDRGLHHSSGLLWIIDKTVPISMLSTREVVDVGRRKEPMSVGGRGKPSISAWSREGTPPAGGSGGIQCVFAAVLANRKTSTPRWATSGRPTSLRICRTATSLTSRSHGATRRPCGQSTLIFGRIRRRGSFADCRMRGCLSRCSNQWITCLLYTSPSPRD